MNARSFSHQSGRKLVAVCLILGACARGFGGLVLTNFSAAHPIQVMAIGDSITDDCSINGAWRLYLQPLLETNGFPFTFVGRAVSTPTTTFTKTHHEGYCGAVTAPPGVMTSAVHGYPGNKVDLYDVVPDALTNVTPDLVLILIGANDLGHGRDPNRLATNDIPGLLGIIFSNAPNANVILTKPTTLQNATAGYGAYATNVSIYNGALQAMVNGLGSLGAQVSVADMFSVVDYSTMFNADHLHPNGLGLSVIAREWLTRIQAITARTDLFTTLLVPAGSDWKYSDTGEDLGTNWSRLDYADQGWSHGPARLGYRDVRVATTVSYGPDASNKCITTYFRRPFVVPDNVAVTNLNIRLSRMDGAVVWLNGRELVRANLPSGTITFTNRATTPVPGGSDAAYTFYPTNIAVSGLLAGTNVLAVEVHKFSPATASLGFDLEMLATGYPLQSPSLAISLAGTQTLLSWPADSGVGYTLYSSTNPAVPAAWVPVPAAMQTNDNRISVTQAVAGTARFFRLQKSQ